MKTKNTVSVCDHFLEKETGTALLKKLLNCWSVDGPDCFLFWICTQNFQTKYKQSLLSYRACY